MRLSRKTSTTLRDTQKKWTELGNPRGGVWILHAAYSLASTNFQESRFNSSDLPTVIVNGEQRHYMAPVSSACFGGMYTLDTAGMTEFRALWISKICKPDATSRSAKQTREKHQQITGMMV